MWGSSRDSAIDIDSGSACYTGLVYVRQASHHGAEVQFCPGVKILWLPVYHVDGLAEIPLGKIGRIYMPGWIVHKNHLWQYVEKSERWDLFLDE